MRAFAVSVNQQYKAFSGDSGAVWFDGSMLMPSFRKTAIWVIYCLLIIAATAFIAISIDVADAAITVVTLGSAEVTRSVAPIFFWMTSILSLISAGLSVLAAQRQSATLWYAAISSGVMAGIVIMIVGLA